MCWKFAYRGGRPGMIKLGFPTVSIYPNDGIVWENRGTVTFKGKASIGNSSKISIGKSGNIEFGEAFGATCALKLACYNNIVFRDNVLIGWDCTVSDTDFHTFTVNGQKTKGYGNILIEENCWIAMQTLILKDTVIPKNSVVGARSTLNKDYTAEGAHVLLAGAPAKIINTNIYYDYSSSQIKYTL